MVNYPEWGNRMKKKGRMFCPLIFLFQKEKRKNKKYRIYLIGSQINKNLESFHFCF